MAASSDSGVDTVFAGPVDLLDDADAYEVPPAIGKYDVVGLLGRGGMGSVYRAFDPDLEREVAVKVLKDAVLRKADPSERASLLREAKALARLNHPNVVAVYEVGEDRGGFFIAMERVDGADLRSWLEETRARPEILARFVEAGRGLHAAHRAGLVHRDFKPGNVLVSDQGAKVTDFGLARATGPDPSMLSSSSGSGSVESLDTRGGTVMGTPAYMSPEQHRGELLDAASDQYSFCMSLYEALAGERPFSGQRGRTLLRSKLKAPPPLPPDAGVPEHVARAILRGLSAHPADRFEDMGALLRELERDPAAVRRRIVAGLGLAAAGGAAVWVSGRFVDDDAPCQLDPGTFAGVWDTDTKAAVEAAFEATEQVYAPRTYRRVQQRLDAYAEQWGLDWAAACRATAVDRAQSQRVLDMRVACLEERRASMRALTTALSEMSPEVLDRVDTMARSLPPLPVCSDLERLEAQVPDPSAAIAGAVAEMRSEIATVRVMQAAGQADVADTELTRLSAAVRALDYPPLTAEVLLLHGQVLDRLARHEEAQALLEEATWLAYGVDHFRVVAYAAMALVWNVSDAQSRGEDGKVWLALADASAKRLAGDVHLEAEIANTRGVLLQDLGDRAGARKAFDAVLEILAGAEGPDQLNRAGAMVNLAILESEDGNFEAALALQKKALALRETYEGRAHPRTATLLNNMSTVLLALERADEAKAANAEALAQLRARYGDEHPLVGTVLVQTAALAFERDEKAEAAEHLREAARVFEATRGRMHRDLSIIYNNAGQVELELGNAEEAVKLLARALEIVEANYDASNPRLKEAKHQLARALRKAGREDEANVLEPPPTQGE